MCFAWIGLTQVWWFASNFMDQVSFRIRCLCALVPAFIMFMWTIRIDSTMALPDMRFQPCSTDATKNSEPQGFHQEPKEVLSTTVYVLIDAARVLPGVPMIVELVELWNSFFISEEHLVVNTAIRVDMLKISNPFTKAPERERLMAHGWWYQC